MPAPLTSLVSGAGHFSFSWEISSWKTNYLDIRLNPWLHEGPVGGAAGGSLQTTASPGKPGRGGLDAEPGAVREDSGHDDASQVDYLSKRLLTATPDQVAVIVAGLADHKAEVVERLWSVLDDANGDADQRLRAACALAAYTPEDPRWKKVGGDVAAKLVTENSLVAWQMD